MRAAIALVALGATSCSMGGATGMADLARAGDGGGADLALAADLAMAGSSVPDPGNMSDQSNDRTEMEPNDTPATAQPIGVLNDLFQGDASLYLGIGGGNPHIGGADPVDWFVFRAGPGVTGFALFACWANNPVNLLDFNVYDVTNGKLGALVGGSNDLATDCENQARTKVPLTAGQVYALEIRSVEGMGDYYS